MYLPQQQVQSYATPHDATNPSYLPPPVKECHLVSMMPGLGYPTMDSSQHFPSIGFQLINPSQGYPSMCDIILLFRPKSQHKIQRQSKQIEYEQICPCQQGTQQHQQIQPSAGDPQLTLRQ